MLKGGDGSEGACGSSVVTRAREEVARTSILYDFRNRKNRTLAIPSAEANKTVAVTKKLVVSQSMGPDSANTVLRMMNNYLQVLGVGEDKGLFLLLGFRCFIYVHEGKVGSNCLLSGSRFQHVLL